MSTDPFASFDEAAKDVAAASGQPLAAGEPPPVDPVGAPPPTAVPEQQPAPVPQADLNALLGVPGVPAAPAEPAQPTRENDRIRDLTEQNRKLQADKDFLMRQQLQPRAEPQPQQNVDPFEGLTDEQREVAELTAPGTQRMFNEFAKQFEPIVKFANEQMGLQMLKSRLEGMDDSVYEEVKREFSELPPEVQQSYANPVGAEALAARVLLQRKASEQGNTQIPAGNTNRAVTLTRSSGMEPAPPREINPHTLPANQFEAVLEHIRNGGKAGDPNEPDSFLYGGP